MTESQVRDYEQLIAELTMFAKELGRVGPSREEPPFGENKFALIQHLLKRATKVLDELGDENRTLLSLVSLNTASYSDATIVVNEFLVTLEQRRLRMLTRAHGRLWWRVSEGEGEKLVPTGEEIAAGLGKVPG